MWLMLCYKFLRQDQQFTFPCSTVLLRSGTLFSNTPAYEIAFVLQLFGFKGTPQVWRLLVYLWERFSQVCFLSRLLSLGWCKQEDYQFPCNTSQTSRKINVEGEKGSFLSAWRCTHFVTHFSSLKASLKMKWLAHFFKNSSHNADSSRMRTSHNSLKAKRDTNAWKIQRQDVWTMLSNSSISYILSLLSLSILLTPTLSSCHYAHCSSKNIKKEGEVCIIQKYTSSFRFRCKLPSEAGI